MSLLLFIVATALLLELTDLIALVLLHCTALHCSLLEEENRDVGRKLGIATGLMFTLPIITYFVAYYYVFPHKPEPSNWAGGAAIFITNIIVFGYVFVAFNEPEEK